MTARIVELANAITADLYEAAQGGRFCREFAPVRSYAPEDMKLDKHGELRIDVVPVGHDSAEMDDRAHLAYVSGIDIGIRYKFSQGDSTSTGEIDMSEIDGLAKLVEQVYEFLAGKRFCEAIWRDGSIRAVYVPKHLREWRQFTGIIRVRFEIDAELEDCP